MASHGFEVETQVGRWQITLQNMLHFLKRKGQTDTTPKSKMIPVRIRRIVFTDAFQSFRFFITKKKDGRILISDSRHSDPSSSIPTPLRGHTIPSFKAELKCLAGNESQRLFDLVMTDDLKLDPNSPSNSPQG